MKKKPTNQPAKEASTTPREFFVKIAPFEFYGAPSYPAISAALRDPQLGIFIRTVYLDGAYTGLIKISRIELI